MTSKPLSVRALSRWALQVLLVGVVAAIAGGAGCSSRDELPPLATGGRAGTGPVEAGPCSEGTIQPCGITLATHGSVVTCFEGTKTCKAGAWSECGNGKTVERRLPGGSGGSFHPQAIGDASPCVNNPCDPFCWNYPNEYPDSPLQAVPADGGTVFNWQTGATGDLPPGLVDKGMKEPCESALDCQFNHHCDHVATDPSCAHNKCLTGAALSATCAQADGCVNMICAQRSTCCGDSCGHDICSTGVKLDSSCSSCVASICATRPSCCAVGGSWDATCVSLVATTCAPLTCGCGPGQIENPATGHCYIYDKVRRNGSAAQTFCSGQGTGWQLVTINDSAENTWVRTTAVDLPMDAPIWIGLKRVGPQNDDLAWFSGEPYSYDNKDAGEYNKTGDCVAMRPANALWHDWYCTTNPVVPSTDLKGSFCEGPKVLSGRSWDSTCAGMVDSVCKATCGSGAGNCEPWLPGEVDPGCAGIDLALGVPCAPPDKTVSVCNHGTVEAPAGIEVMVFPGNSPQYPLCTPDTGQQFVGPPCLTTAPIPPGDCVNLVCDKLVTQQTLIVNPPGTTHQAECNCLDNWAIYDQAVNCGTPACGGTTFRATFKRVNLFVIVNRASSMAGAKWTGSVAALTSFFQDPQAAGVGVGLEFFPIEPNKSAGSLTSGDGCPSSACGGVDVCTGCDVSRCQNPMVSPAPLAFFAAPNDTQEDRLIQALGVGTFGNAPSRPALEGTLNAAVAYQAANSNSVTAVVFATDGEPDECLTTNAATTNAAMATLAGAAAAQGVNTHTICLPGANCTALNAIAAAGGTTQSRVIGGATVQADMLAALRAIAGQTVSCTFALPVVGTFNLSNVTVTYTPSGSTTPQTLTRVQTAGDCASGGWYFNNNSSPTSISLCPSTCATLRADFGGDIVVELGCPVPLTATALSEVYEGVCPNGSGPQWNFLSYDSVVPPNTSLQFSVRTAATIAGLGMAMYHPVAAVPTDPAVCTIGVTGCPADLYQALGISDARLKYLELAMTFTPTPNGLTAPTVNNWQIYYSCPANQ